MSPKIAHSNLHQLIHNLPKFLTEANHPNLNINANFRFFVINSGQLHLNSWQLKIFMESCIKLIKKAYIDVAKPCDVKTLDLRKYLEVLRDLDHHFYGQLHRSKQHIKNHSWKVDSLLA